MVNAMVTIRAGGRQLPVGWVKGTAIAAAALVAAPPMPALAQSQTQVAKASVKIVKPLVLTWQQDLTLGDILIPTTSFGNTVVSLSRTGAFSCPAPLICSGAPMVARYHIAGSNNNTVRIAAPSVTLVNQADSSKTLTMTVDNPGTITLPNSGQPGTAFALGGAITVNSSTAEGSYEGTFNVTVDYQ